MPSLTKVTLNDQPEAQQPHQALVVQKAAYRNQQAQLLVYQHLIINQRTVEMYIYYQSHEQHHDNTLQYSHP